MSHLERFKGEERDPRTAIVNYAEHIFEQQDLLHEGGADPSPNAYVVLEDPVGNAATLHFVRETPTLPKEVTVSTLGANNTLVSSCLLLEPSHFYNAHRSRYEGLQAALTVPTVAHRVVPEGEFLECRDRIECCGYVKTLQTFAREQHGTIKAHEEFEKSFGPNEPTYRYSVELPDHEGTVWEQAFFDTQLMSWLVVSYSKGTEAGATLGITSLRTSSREENITVVLDEYDLADPYFFTNPAYKEHLRLLAYRARCAQLSPVPAQWNEAVRKTIFSIFTTGWSSVNEENNRYLVLPFFNPSFIFSSSVRSLGSLDTISFAS